MTETPHRARFERATPVLRCADYPTARAFYRDKLGFTVVEEGGDPPRFGILERDRAVVFLDAWNGPPTPGRKGWDAYFHVEDLDGLYRACREAGVEPAREIELTVYGMREFELLDPDGSRLCFGEDPEDRRAS